MLSINCPVCGSRPSGEFAYSGEPSEDPAATTSVSAWRRYLYVRPNRPDWTTERWLHVAGCGRFTVLERHRTTNHIRTMTSLSTDGPRE
jgi:sarcosine oxidase, subunit delta